MERNLGNRRGYGEHDVEVGHWQQLGLACFKPFGTRQALALRAVPITARGLGATNEPTIGTVLDVPAQRRRPTRLDCRHDAALGATEMVRVGSPVRRAVVAENIRHLQHGAHRDGSGGWS